MNVLDVDLIRPLLKQDTYKEFADYLKSYMLTEIAWGLVGDFGKYYEKYDEEEIDEHNFRIWFRITAHPEWKTEKHSAYASIFDNLFSSVGSETIPALDVALLRNRLSDCLKSALEEGDTQSISDIYADMQRLEETATDPRSLIIDTPIQDILDNSSRLTGIEWRLEDLNRSIGPIGGGDLIIVGKRPETGGTSFLLSEVSYWLTQLPENKPNALIINNEESSERIISRSVSVVLNKAGRDVFSSREQSALDYIDELKGRELSFVSEPDISITQIESLLSSQNYGALGINVLAKVTGLSSRKLEDFQRLERLFAWARRVAVEYSIPVIAIHQADASAEGERYPDQNMLYGSKTGVQGEADVLIMIGKDNTEGVSDTSRFIHVAKNKLPGGPRTRPDLRHIKTEVHFNPETGRYTTNNTW